MMRVIAIGIPLLVAIASYHALAMNNYEDPRVVLSYMDKSLDGSRDILRLTTAVDGNTHLVFEVKTRAEHRDPQPGDYVLLEISQGQSHQLLVSIDPELGDDVLVYEQDLAPGGSIRSLAESSLKAGSREGVFSVRRVPRGVEFLVPLDWIDYREKIAFDAFTIRGQRSGASFRVAEIYDQAGKGQKERRLFSPITLLNNLCATRK